MIAALQPLRAQEVGELVGPARQRGEGKFCFLVAAGIDDPQRRAVLARGIARQFRVEPVQCPVERHRVRPAESLHRRIVVGAVLEQKRTRILECCHVSNLLKAVISAIPTSLILRSRALARRLEGWTAHTELVILRGSQLLAPPATRAKPLRRDDDCHFPASSRTCWMMPEKSTPPCPAASNAW